MTTYDQGAEHAQREVHRLPHVDARRGVHRVQRLLSVGRGARRRDGAGGREAAHQLPRRRRVSRDHAAVGRDHHASRRRTGATGDHIMVAPLGTCGSGQPCSRGNGMDMDQQSGLAWFDLESAATVDINNLATSLKGTAWNWIYPPRDRPLRGGAVVEPRRHAGAVHDDRQGEVGTPRHQRERAPLHASPTRRPRAQAAMPRPRRRVGGRARAVLRRAVRRRQAASPTTSWTRPRRTTSTRRSIRWT